MKTSVWFPRFVCTTFATCRHWSVHHMHEWILTENYFHTPYLVSQMSNNPSINSTWSRWNTSIRSRTSIRSSVLIFNFLFNSRGFDSKSVSWYRIHVPAEPLHKWIRSPKSLPTGLELAKAYGLSSWCVIKPQQLLFLLRKIGQKYLSCKKCEPGSL